MANFIDSGKRACSEIYLGLFAYVLTPWPAVPHFTAYPFSPQYRTLPHLRLPAVPHFTALPYLFRFVSRKTRCSWRIEYIFISLEPEKFTLYTGMKKIQISISKKVFHKDVTLVICFLRRVR